MWNHFSCLLVWASFIGIEMSPCSWDICQSSHLAMCSAKICRMETVCLSTECSSSQQLLNETVTGHRKTENTDDYGKKLYGAEKMRTEKDY